MHDSDSVKEGKDTVATIFSIFFKGGGWGWGVGRVGQEDMRLSE